jgi:hypothetical protein
VRSVLHVVPTVVEVRLNDPMIRKQLPGLVITPRVGQLGILGGVLNVLVSDPVLHKLEFTPGIEEVRRNGMFERMELAPLRREPGFLAVRLHRTPQRLPIKGTPRFEMNRYGEASVRARRYARSNLMTSGCNG